MEYTKAALSCAFTNKTVLNTAIPGQKGYKSIDKTATIEQQRQYMWLYKG
jgi:hypothetical protein